MMATFRHLRNITGVIVLLALCLTACGTTPHSDQHTAPVPPPPIAPYFQWLKGIPCQTPCFGGITPGRTTATEAVAVLKSNDAVFDVQVNTPSENDYSNTSNITWHWKGYSTQNAWASAVYVTRDVTQTIGAISVHFPETVRLDSVIHAYGMPTDVITKADYDSEGRPGGYSIVIIDKAHGFALDVAPSYAPASPINADLPLTRIEFYVPTNAGLATMLKETGLESFADLSEPWHGYGSFASYCTHAYCRLVQTP